MKLLCISVWPILELQQVAYILDANHTQPARRFKAQQVIQLVRQLLHGEWSATSCRGKNRLRGA